MEKIKTIQLLMKCPGPIDAEVRAVVETMFHDFDFSNYYKAFSTIIELFSGQRSGFLPCDTKYHDLNHTLGTLLAAARLIHGVHNDRQAMSPRVVELLLISALFHDTGYIRCEEESRYTGGMFTKTHVNRSISLLEEFIDDTTLRMEDFLDMETVVQCTDPATPTDKILFPNIETMLAGHILGTADIISQTADDIYLEKLPFLFQEFQEGGITDFTSEYDLFLKTMDFYAFMRDKMENHLSNVIASMSTHFSLRYGVNRDFYSEAAQRNMHYLSSILNKYGASYHTGLRRKLDRPEYPINLAA